MKLCLDHRFAVAQSTTDHGSLLAVCEECAELIKKTEPPANIQSEGVPLIDVLLPIQQISILCDNTVGLSSISLYLKEIRKIHYIEEIIFYQIG